MIRRYNARVALVALLVTAHSPAASSQIAIDFQASQFQITGHIATPREDGSYSVDKFIGGLPPGAAPSLEPLTASFSRRIAFPVASSTPPNERPSATVSAVAMHERRFIPIPGQASFAGDFLGVSVYASSEVDLAADIQRREQAGAFTINSVCIEFTPRASGRYAMSGTRLAPLDGAHALRSHLEEITQQSPLGIRCVEGDEFGEERTTILEQNVDGPFRKELVLLSGHRYRLTAGLVEMNTTVSPDGPPLADEAARGEITLLLQSVDVDNDGVQDIDDNCTVGGNPAQRDSDNDGYGNQCDADYDQNGVVNFIDLAKLKSRFFALDASIDLTGDGVVNFADLSAFKKSFLRPPGPARLDCTGQVPCLGTVISTVQRGDVRR